MIAMHYAPCSCCCIPKDTLLQCYYAYAHTCPIVNQVYIIYIVHIANPPANLYGFTQQLLLLLLPQPGAFYLDSPQ